MDGNNLRRKLTACLCLFFIVFERPMSLSALENHVRQRVMPPVRTLRAAGQQSGQPDDGGENAGRQGGKGQGGGQENAGQQDGKMPGGAEENHGDAGRQNLPKLQAPALKGMYARAYCLYDAAQGRTLYQHNGTERMPMASTTKIMTLIVLLENAQLDDIVTVSRLAASQPDVQLNIREGEQYRLKDLLYSLMLESHNDTAVALAEHVGGSVEGFCAMMNAKAAELGLVDTCFETPNGLDSENHYTTAVELAKIAAYAIENEEFIRITNTTSYQFDELTTGRSLMVSNKNRFLYMMEGAIGVKTGFTGKAGYCFVGALKRGDHKLISVVLACGWPPNKNYKWSDTRKLMDYGLTNYRKRSMEETMRLFCNGAEADPKVGLAALIPGEIPVADGVSERVAVSAGQLFVPELLLADWDECRAEVEYETLLTAPVEEGLAVGTVTFYAGEDMLGQSPIRTVQAVPKLSFFYCLGQIFDSWLGCSE